MEALLVIALNISSNNGVLSVVHYEKYEQCESARVAFVSSPKSNPDIFIAGKSFNERRVFCVPVPKVD